MSSAMTNPFDYRDIMKASFRYNETRTVDQVLADQRARDDEPQRGVSKTPPPPGRAATVSELEAARKLLGAAKPDNFAPPQ